ncbi:MAG: SAM-dependent methyltransferase, partial [Bacteroidales bacterium]|nr:SAM-dependent methyltransferase [Candidatus Equibacterium intestinale]
MNAETLCFILEHENDNTDSLFLAKGNYPEVDIEAAVHAIEARRKVRTKIPIWYEFTDIEYPTSLSVEQCSSQATALYKQNLVKGWKAREVLDLTTGLGVDSFFMSMEADHLTCLERNPELVKAAEHNFKTLERYNIN